MHRIFKTYKSTANNLILLRSSNTQKNEPLQTVFEEKKKTLYYSNINNLFTLALRKSGDLSAPGCAWRVNLNGDGVKLQGFTESLMINLHFTFSHFADAFIQSDLQLGNT